MTFYAGGGNAAFSNGATVVQVAHDNSSGLDGKRSVLAVLTKDTQSVTSIVVSAGGAPGGWTAQGTFTGQGKTWWLFDKICDSSEPSQYDVNFSPGLVRSGDVNDVIAYIADFTTGGAAIRATSSADAASGTNLTLPSLTAATAEDICAVVWDHPATSVGRLLAVSPLIGTAGEDGGMDLWTQLGHENYHSSDPTGTRSFAVASGTHSGALAVMMLVGSYAPPGGWGVGQIRMNG